MITRAAHGDTRLAVDIGGTFTDVVLEHPGGRSSAKVLTTPREPELGVMQGVARILADTGVDARRIGVFIHGTTLATNALIERRGARTALVTTAGMRDVLEMGYERRFDHYDVQIEHPPPLVPRPLRIEVAERVAADGRVLLALDEAALDGIAARLADDGVEAVAIGFLHAWRYPDHERRARDRLAARLGDAVTICVSSEVCPELREYERFSTTVANAYVRPLMAGYLTRLRDLLDGAGLACPMFLMISGGGLTTLEQATRFPIRLLESGPAGGAIFAAAVADELGLTRALSFDMGGTTAKICLIEDGRPERTPRFEAARQYRDIKGSGLPIRVPSVEMVEIGAGGGSIARVDALGRLHVGPRSAGAEPGPACYGRGGAHATVTDANLALGRLDAAAFAGGTIALDGGAARAALAREVGEPLALDAHWPAAAVSEIVEENMANAARVHAIERGRTIGDYAMIAYGGGAPPHAVQLARKLGVDTIVVPRSAGVGSAVGFLRAPIAYEVVRSHRSRLEAFDVASTEALLATMRDEAVRVVLAGAEGLARAGITRRVAIRYVGQGHELMVDVPDGPLGDDVARRLRDGFETAYRATYGMTIPAMGTETVSWSVTATLGGLSPPPPRDATSAGDDGAPAVRRRFYDPGAQALVDGRALARNALLTGVAIDGPAVITEAETSTIVPGGYRAELTPGGHLLIRRASDHG